MPYPKFREMEDGLSIVVGPSMTMPRLDEILAENHDKSKFNISWERTPIHWEMQVESKRFWFTLWKVVHVNDLPKTIHCAFSITTDIYGTPPTPGTGFDKKIKV